jgi:hypothetical protein
VVSSYCHPYCFKTDAPNSFIFQIRDKWAYQSKKQNGLIKEEKQEKELLKKREDISFEINDEVKNYLDETITSRFLPNPEKNWGPLSSAKLIFNPNKLKKQKKK